MRSTIHVAASVNAFTKDGGFGAVINTDGILGHRSGRSSGATVHRMLLHAAIEGLKATRSDDVMILSNNHNLVMIWQVARKKGFIKKGQPRVNYDLWTELDRLAASRSRVVFKCGGWDEDERGSQAFLLADQERHEMASA